MKQYLSFLLVGLLIGSAAYAAPRTEGIAAVVNAGIVTQRDVSDRIALIIGSTGMPRSADLTAKLKPEILETLITEELQLQAAADAGVTVPDTAITEAMTRIAADNKMDLAQFQTLLKRQGVNINSLKHQLAAQLNWGALVTQKLRPQIVVSDGEIAAEKERIKQYAGQNEYLLAEIFLADTTERSGAKTTEFAQRLIGDMRKGARFSEIARQFSQSVTAPSGGMLGWLRDDQLDPYQKSAIQNLEPEKPLSEPVRGENGVHIYLLRSKRLIALNDAAAGVNDTEIALRVLRVPVLRDDRQGAVKRADDIRIRAKTCEDVAARAAAEKDLRLANMTMRLSTMADAEKQLMAGDALGAVGTAQLEGNKAVSVKYVCARKPVTGTQIDDEIANRLGQARLEILARRYLRDLTAQAFIERRL